MADVPAFAPLNPLLFAALAATVESLTRLRERAQPPGTLVPIQNRNLHILYTTPPPNASTNPPCVVLEAGANSWSPMWEAVATEIRPVARVFRYDRPGFGFSDPVSVPRPISAIAEDLLSALITIGAHPPYVLVAHSLGALYINALVCRLHSADVAGVVYVDAASLETVRMLERVVSSSIPPRWLVRIIASLGLLRLLAPFLLRPYAKAFRGPLRKHALTTWARAGWLLSYTGEWASALKESREHPGYKPGWLGSTPITVIVPDVYERTKGKAYITALQRAVADYSHDSEIVPVADCGHFVQLERPDVVAAAVFDIITRARTKLSLPDKTSSPT